MTVSRVFSLRHPLVPLCQTIDWPLCERKFGGLYATGVGRPGHPIQLMVGLQLLKHTCNVSDEGVVATWVENPYWQYFCREQYFRHDLPIDPSLVLRPRGSLVASLQHNPVCGKYLFFHFVEQCKVMSQRCNKQPLCNTLDLRFREPA